MNGCLNYIPPTAETWYWAQDGYTYIASTVSGEHTRVPKLVKVYHKMTFTCNYDKQKTDKGCRGCRNCK